MRLTRHQMGAERRRPAKTTQRRDYLCLSVRSSLRCLGGCVSRIHPCLSRLRLVAVLRLEANIPGDGETPSCLSVKAVKAFPSV